MAKRPTPIPLVGVEMLLLLCAAASLAGCGARDGGETIPLRQPVDLSLPEPKTDDERAAVAVIGRATEEISKVPSARWSRVSYGLRKLKPLMPARDSPTPATMAMCLTTWTPWRRPDATSSQPSTCRCSRRCAVSQPGRSSCSRGNMHKDSVKCSSTGDRVTPAMPAGGAAEEHAASPARPASPARAPASLSPPQTGPRQASSAGARLLFRARSEAPPGTSWASAPWARPARRR